jgi:hypothetical protein
MSTAARTTVDVPFPHYARMLCYLAIEDGVIVQVDRREVDALVTSGVTVWAAWPGQWRTDLFVLDAGVPAR